jgi:Transposase DDE domain
MYTDALRVTAWDRISQQGLRAFLGLLTLERVCMAAGMAGLVIGANPLHLGNLAWLGISAALHTTQTFVGILGFTLKLLQDSPFAMPAPLRPPVSSRKRRSDRPKRSKHDPRRESPTQLSEEAFTQARHAMPLSFWAALLVVLGECFQADHGNWVRWKQFRLLAMDGTTIDLENWKPLRDHFGTANNGSGKHVPQARMVMLQFPLARLPYRYELTPRSISENASALALAKHLQPGDLVLLDRGFWSYGLFCQILAQGAHLGIRMKKGMTLKNGKWLGKKDQLMRWNVPKKHKNKGYLESIPLRRIDYQVPGFRPSSVVTTVTDPRQMTREDWVRLTTQTEPGDRRLGVGLYHRRWEIETTFSELKVRQGMEGKLRSRTPQGIAYEIAGHVLLYLLVRWLMVEAAVEHDLDPLRISFLNALREVQDMVPALTTASPQRIASVLLPRLLQRIAQHLVRERPGRHFPRPNDTKIKNKGYGEFRLPSKLRASQA